MCDNDIEQYKTIEHIEGNGWKVLPNVYKYQIHREVSKLFEVTNINFVNEYYYNWLYYAYFSPIWKERLAKYNYRICNETKQIIMNPPRSCYIYVIFPCHAIYMKILTVGSDGQKYIDPWKHKVLY